MPTRAEYEEYLKNRAAKDGKRPAPASKASTKVSSTGLPARAANAWRDNTSQDFRDSLGGFLRTATSGERTLDLVSNGGYSREAENLPGFLRTAIDVAAAPTTLLTAGFGTPISAALRSVPVVGRAAAAVASPLLRGGFVPNLAAETVAGTAGMTAANAVSSRLPENTPGAIKVGLPLAAGALAGGAGIGAISRGVRANAADTVRSTLPTSMGGGVNRGADVPSMDYITGSIFSAPSVESAKQLHLSNVLPRSGVKGLVEQSVARDMERQRQSALAGLIQNSRTAMIALPKTDVDETGNAVFLGILDPDSGKNAYVGEVMQNPTKFDLTPEQRTAIDSLNENGLPGIVRKEAEIFGLPREDALIPEGMLYAPRKVIGFRDPKTGKIEILEDLAKVRGTTRGGQNTVVLRDRERQFTTQREGIDAGFIYADYLTTLEDYYKTGLENIQNHHIANLLKTFGFEVKGDDLPVTLQKVMAGTRAPQLTNYAFSEGTAKTITEYFARGVLPENQLGKGMTALGKANRVLTPARAILDASGTFNQNAIIAATNPLMFVNSLVKSFGSAVSDKSYRSFYADPTTGEVGRYVTILGEGVSAADFQFGESLRRLPVIKHLQRQFEHIGNENRKALFNDTIDVLRRNGQVIDEATKIAVGRGIDRITGIAAGKAGDIEAAALFAPNFLRSMIENVMAAATNNGIEGQIARQYLSRYVATGMTLTAMAAITQGRELKEVLNPLDPYGLKQGEIRLNPNFATVRVAGQDVSMFGAYDSLARLAMVAGDATFRSVAEQDATQLADFFGFALRTKGSPMIAHATNFVYGSTFSGENPASMMGLVEGTIPFTFADLVQSYREGDSPTEVGAGFFTSFMGLKSRTQTASERRDEVARAMFNDRPFEELSGEEKQELALASPELMERVDKTLQRRAASGDVSAKARVQRADLDAERMAKETETFAAHQEGKITRQQMAEGLDKLQQEYAVRKEQTDRALGINYEDGSLTSKAVSRYYETFKDAEIAPGQIDWELQSLLEAALYGDITAGKYGDPVVARKMVDERAKPLHSPEVEWYWKNKQLIQEAGYYDLIEKVFEQNRIAASRAAGKPVATLGAFIREMAIAEASNDARQLRRMMIVQSRIDSKTSRLRKQARRKNDDLDRALVNNGRVAAPAR